MKQASEFIGAPPTNMGRTNIEIDLKRIWWGCVWENVPVHDRNLKLIASLLGLANHSTCHEWNRQWLQLDWKVRHGWLVLFEGFRGFGTPIREGIRDIDEFVSENFDEP
jgi:hypothetical protein